MASSQNQAGSSLLKAQIGRTDLFTAEAVPVLTSFDISPIAPNAVVEEPENQFKNIHKQSQEVPKISIPKMKTSVASTKGAGFVDDQEDADDDDFKRDEDFKMEAASRPACAGTEGGGEADGRGHEPHNLQNMMHLYEKQAPAKNGARASQASYFYTHQEDMYSHTKEINSDIVDALNKDKDSANHARAKNLTAEKSVGRRPDSATKMVGRTE